jgi:hypothetical protein
MQIVGQTLLVKGNFTTLGFLDGLSGPTLERTLGFSSGRLSAGFAVVALADGEALRPDEIELKGSTRWSGGHIGPVGSEVRRELEAILRERTQDVASLKAKVCTFLARRGRNTPAKVIPGTVHAAGMQYPDAEALGVGIRSGVPQFNLVMPKRFTVIRIG